MSKKTSAPKKRATQSEMALRVNKIADLLLCGRGRSYILDFCEAHYGISTRATDELIQRANERILEASSGKVEEIRARIVGGYYTQYRKLKKEPLAAASMLDRIAKIHGLDQQTLNLNFNRPLAAASDDELESAAAQAETGHD